MSRVGAVGLMENANVAKIYKKPLSTRFLSALLPLKPGFTLNPYFFLWPLNPLMLIHNFENEAAYHVLKQAKQINMRPSLRNRPAKQNHDIKKIENRI